MAIKLGDYQLELDAILVRVQEIDETANPNIQGYKRFVISQTEGCSKIAKYWTIRDSHTGQTHHHSLTLQTIRRLQEEGLGRS